MKKTLLSLFGLVVLLFGAAAVLIASIDVDHYRSQIVTTLSQKTGRIIKLNGPIHLNLSWSGLAFSIADAAIGNPGWASRPDMAGIGHFRLGIAFLPLLQNRLVITDLQISDADIQLETGPQGHNWDLQISTPKETAATPSAELQTPPASLRIDKILITDSQIAWRTPDGATTTFKAKKLTLGLEEKGLAAHFVGESNGNLARLDIKTGTTDFGDENAWPFNLDLLYGLYHLHTKGTADLGNKKLNLLSYKLTAGDITTNLSDLHGQINIAWAPHIPEITGTLQSDHLNVSDFIIGNDSTAPATTISPPKDVDTASSTPLFSNAPLGLENLKSANMALDIALADITHGDIAFKKIEGRLILQDGILSLDPLKIQLGNGEMLGRFKVDSQKSPPQMGLSFTAPNVDLADLLHMGGVEAFLSGKAQADASLASSGNSMHDFAKNLGGTINVVADDGHISGSEATLLSPGLMNILAPKGTSALNCLAARFLVANGVMRDHGILLDTTMTTVAGSGAIDLGNEQLNVELRAKPKVMVVGDLLPPLSIAGSLRDPDYKVDPRELIKSVSGILSSGEVDNGVPDIEEEQGQNACAYTLNNPNAGKSSSLLAPGLGGKMDKIKKLGGKLLNLLGE